MKSTSTLIAVLAAIVLIGGAVLVTKTESQDQSSMPVNNVTVVDGKQIIEINAKGGYQPRRSIAKSGIPTILRFNTKGTFDCSSSVRIPSLNISKMLPQTGTTDINLGVPNLALLQGTCGMGMYPFEIDFQG